MAWDSPGSGAWVTERVGLLHSSEGLPALVPDTVRWRGHWEAQLARVGLASGLAPIRRASFMEMG